MNRKVARIAPRIALGIVAALAVISATGFYYFRPATWDGARAMDDIATQVGFGARAATGTPGHQQEIDFIQGELGKTSARVELQQGSFTAQDKSVHPVTNIVARFDPGNPRRVIVGTHYDSILRAYRDKQHPDAVMPGANNSASGVALLLETARVLESTTQKPLVGVDFVFFDGEEGPLSLGGGDPHWEAMGSPYFASQLRALYPNGNPKAAAIFDMVCYSGLKLNPEPISAAYAGQEMKQFWDIGTAHYPALFQTEPSKSPIEDDQLALLEAGIPSFLVIGFDYEPWFNTTGDTPDKCSAASLKAVGRTLTAYLYGFR